MIGIHSFHPSRSWRWPCSPSPINGQQRLISTVRLGLDKYERSSSKHWNDFYKRHQSKFFKDRHYLEEDWGRFFSDESENCKSEKGKVVLEVGCGAGNTIFPLITAFPNLFIHACDFSPLAIKLVKEHGDFRADRVNAFVSDITVDDLSKKISPSSVDVVTLFLPRRCRSYCRMLERFLSQMAMCFSEIMPMETLLKKNSQAKID